MVDYYIFFCYLIGPIITTGISFIDILDDYSVFHIKFGLKYKIIFALINGAFCFTLLVLLWNSELLEGFTDPLSKGLYFGLAYSVLLKSKIVIYGKRNSEYLSPAERYNKVINYFRELIDEPFGEYITETKLKIAKKHSLDDLYYYAKDLTEDSPWLCRDENIVTQKEYLDGIKRIYDDDETSQLERSKSLAVFLIKNFPPSIDKLLNSDINKQQK